MSGVMNGQTDIFVYSLSAHTYEQITKDIYDDLDPVFINNSKEIIFSSNRVSDTIRTASKDSILVPTSKQDLFLYNYENKDKILRRLTNSELTNETNPLVINDNYISYLSDKNGIVNRYTAKLDSAINFVDTTTHYRYFMTSYPQTNYSRNILDYNICPDKSKLGEIIYNNGKYQIYTGELASTDNLTKL
jgi:Tol biopolymer transport system component